MFLFNNETFSSMAFHLIVALTTCLVKCFSPWYYFVICIFDLNFELIITEKGIFISEQL